MRSRFVQVVIDLWLHRPSKANSFVFVFVYSCESQLASLRRICIAMSLPQIFQKHMFQLIFEYFFVDIHHRLRPRRGLGRLGSLEGKKRRGFLHTLFSRFFANLDSLRITGLTICCTARAKQTVLYLFLYIIVNPNKHR